MLVFYGSDKLKKQWLAGGNVEHVRAYKSHTIWPCGRCNRVATY